MFQPNLQTQATIEFTTRLTHAILYLASDRLYHLRFTDQITDKTTAFAHPYTLSSVEGEKEAFSTRGVLLIENLSKRCPWWGFWKENSSRESERLLKEVMVWFSERFEGREWEEVEMLEENRVVWDGRG